MSKKKLKKHTAKTKNTKTNKPFFIEGIKHAVFGYIILILGLAILSLVCIKQDVSLQTVKFAGYAICAVSFLLTGMLSGLHPVLSEGKDALFSGFLLLIALFVLLLLVSKGTLGAFSLLLVAMGTLLPLIGSIIVQKLK